MDSTALRILLVEDNPIEAALARTWLDSSNVEFDLTCVENAADALDRLRTTRFDAALLDLSLPDSEGLPTLERIVAADPDLPIVVLTGTDDEAIAIEAIGKGAQDYLVKGQFSGALIIRAIRYARERKRAEEAIRQEQQFSESLLDSLPGIFYLYTYPENRLVLWNKQHESLLGYEASEIRGRFVADWHMPEAKDAVLNAVEEVMKIGQKSVEACLVTKDGRQIPFFLTGVRFEARGRLFLMGIGIDISDRKRAEESLRESERRLSMALEMSHAGIWEWNLKTGEACFDERFHAILGYQPGELPTKLQEWMLYHHPDDRALMASRAEAHIRGDSPIFMSEHRIRNKAGEWVWVLVLGQVVHVAATASKERFLGLAMDITDRKKAEEAIYREKLLSESIINSLPGVFYLFDEFGRLERWNKNMEQVTGYSAEEVLGMRVLDLIAGPDKEQVGEKIRAAFTQGAADAEALLACKNGKSIPYRFTGHQMALNGRPVVIGIGLDITERKRAEEELKAHKDHLEELVKRRTEELVFAKEAAEAANRAKSSFLATISHEIRTPMTAILGYADLLMDPTLTASSRNNYATTIRRSGEHLLGLINDILDLSKIEAGKMTLGFEHCRLVAILADVASLLRPRAQERGISFTVEYSGAIPETIHTDSARLRQAIINLAGNAIKFTEKGSVRILVSFLSDASKKEPVVRLDVIDTGIGIRKETLPDLFHPFSQGDTSVTRKYGGTGLGLAISHHLARLLGGDLTVESELGQGSTFTLMIPTGRLDGVSMLENPAEAAQEDSEKTWVSEVEDLTGIRILLAEDGIDNRELIEAILRRVGAEVETAENGRIAVEKAQSQSFDLVLMDMNMPEMDGYEATRILRDRGYRGPIVALTANAMIGDSERCRIAGCDEYLTKPIDRRRLIQIVGGSVATKALAAKTVLLNESDRSLADSAGRVSVEEGNASLSSGEAANALPSNPETPSVGQQAIVSEFIDDPDMVPIIERFIGRLADQLDAMQQALANHKHEDLRRLAHRLKGSGGSYGYPQLTDVCRVLEDAARTHDDTTEAATIEDVTMLVHAIENAWGTTKDE